MGRLVKETYRAGEGERQHDPEYKAPVADAVGDKCFLRCVACFLAIDVVTDEQVGTESNPLPTDKHQEEVVSQYQRQHREHEQVEKREEAIEPFVAMHVANSEQVN
jgi:hypothetical protein